MRGTGRLVLAFILVVLPIAGLAITDGPNLARVATIRNAPVKRSQTAPQVLDLDARDALHNRWLTARFEQILPRVMRREGIDMWIVICREHAEDPVYLSLVPQPSMFAWRLTMFVYTDRGSAGVERLTVNRYGGGDLHKSFPSYYTAAWDPESVDPWDRLAQIVRDRKPRKIAINESSTFAFADGLSASLKARLVQALGPEYAKRLVSSERLAVGWLETRTPDELEFYRDVVAITHRVAAEAFSSAVITPGVTTIDDLESWVRRRFAALDLDAWFPPMFYIVRAASAGPASRVVQRGDLLRCDIGFKYVGLASDIQQVAYVLREGEKGPPEGLAIALAKGNRLQDILAAEFRDGLTGNAVLAAALARARAEGLVPHIYSHPLGYHGHAAGSRIGLPDMQDGVPGMGDYPVYANTVWAIELGVRVSVPEWNNEDVQMALEEDAAFTAAGVVFLDGRQTRLHVIR
jgi:Xaa-Pro aminopeptidase